jgi:hypothetical protein
MSIISSPTPHLFRAHVHHLFAHALRYPVVPFRLEQGELRFLHQGKGHRERSAPAYDIAGDQHPRSRCGAATDAVADFLERHECAVAVPYRRDAVQQLPLCEFQHQLRVALTVFDDRFAAPGVAVDRCVDITVDETGQQVFPLSLYDERVRRKRVAAARDVRYAAVADDHGPVFQRGAAVTVNHRYVGDRDRILCQSTCGCYKQQT